MASESDLFNNANPNHGEEPDGDLSTIPTIYISSFGHRRGPLVPSPDLSFDLRSLPCPPKNLRTAQTGLHKPLRNWLFSNPQVQSRFNDICEAIKLGVQNAEANGVPELHVGVFCELGKHRSVSIVEELKRQRFNDWNVVVQHRDAHLKNPSRHKKVRQGHSHGNDFALVCPSNNIAIQLS
jgi:RNase adaptor protein for sRNA GlmZ degradation